MKTLLAERICANPKCAKPFQPSRDRMRYCCLKCGSGRPYTPAPKPVDRCLLQEAWK